MESRPTEVTELCDRILSTAIMLKLLDEAERVTIATFRSEEDVKNLLKGKARQDIIGRKYKGFDYYIDRPFSTRKLVNLRTTDGYKKYLFEIYRPLTLRRIGLDRLTKIDIRDGTLAGACAHYGKKRHRVRHSGRVRANHRDTARHERSDIHMFDGFSQRNRDCGI